MVTVLGYFMNLLFCNTVTVHTVCLIIYRTVINSFDRDVEVVSIPRFCNTFSIDHLNDWHFRYIFQSARL